jgi:hypothetical protein
VAGERDGSAEGRRGESEVRAEGRQARGAEGMRGGERGEGGGNCLLLHLSETFPEFKELVLSYQTEAYIKATYQRTYHVVNCVPYCPGAELD